MQEELDRADPAKDKRLFFVAFVMTMVTKDDRKDIERFLDETRSSPSLAHPLAASPARRARVSGTFDAATRTNPGRRTAFPCVRHLPPVPYYGENLEEFLDFEQRPAGNAGWALSDRARG